MYIKAQPEILNKIKIYHFHNGSGGGVLSVIKNLVKFSSNDKIENHVIHAVNKNLFPEFKIEAMEGAITQQVYFYSPSNNFYYTCRQLAKLLPSDKAIIVAHDWVELGMVSNLGLQNKVVHILHGNYEYYYTLAINHQKIIDAFVCISPIIFNNLKCKISYNLEKIFYLNFPVENLKIKNKKNDGFNIFYAAGNLKDENKQFKIVIKVAEIICKMLPDVFFTIAGSGFTETEFYELWPSELKRNVIYKGLIKNEKLLNILTDQDVFLLPSLLEGFPVSLIEAMKAGVVAMVTDWDNAVDELITPGVTGFYFKVGAVNDYVQCIKRLYADSVLLKSISQNGIERANAFFEPYKNTQKFEELYLTVSNKNTDKKNPFKVYGSRLDEQYIPNAITTFIRNLTKKNLVF